MLEQKTPKLKENDPYF